MHASAGYAASVRFHSSQQQLSLGRREHGERVHAAAGARAPGPATSSASAQCHAVAQRSGQCGCRSGRSARARRRSRRPRASADSWCAPRPPSQLRRPRADRPPGLARRRCAVVAVVQQRGEQRGGCRHAAAALGERERGMLMPQQLRERAGCGVPRRRPRFIQRRRSGRVLMNKPMVRSAPSPPCMRPNRTVPNTTSCAATGAGHAPGPGEMAQGGETDAEPACCGAQPRH